MFRSLFNWSIFRIRISIVFLLLGCISFNGSAQQTSSIDSLENLLSTSSDTTRVVLLNTLSEIYGRATSQKALPYAEEAIALSEKLSYRKGIAKSYRTLAIAHFFKNEHSKAIEYLFISATKAAAIEAWDLEAQDYLNIAAVHASVFGNYSKAMEYYTKALTVFEMHQVSGKLHDAYAGIASVYIHQKEFGKALDYLTKSIRLLETNGDKNALAIVYQKIGDIYLEKDSLDEVESYYNKSLENFKSSNSNGGIMTSLLKLSTVFRMRHDYERALKNDLEAYELSKSSTYERGRLYCLESLGKTYMAMKDYAKSKAFFEESITLSQRSKMMEKSMELYKDLADVTSSMNNFEEAYQYQRLHTVYVDSVRSKERTQQLAEMEVRFETDRREKENQLLKKDNDLNKLYTAIALISLLSIGIIAVLFVNRQRIKLSTTKALSEKERELLEVELKNAQLSESQLRSEIEYKNKELTTYTLNLIQKNEIMEELKSTLEQIRATPSQELSSRLNGMISSVNFSFHLDREWDGFKKHFEEVHESFFDKLRIHFPALNMNDMKLCALLKLNLETKEVATILGISADSTKVARHRLRKKLNLTTDQNLSSFLSSL